MFNLSQKLKQITCKKFKEKSGNIIHYDTRLFEERYDGTSSYLYYIGPTNVEVHIPEGLKSCYRMFEGCKFDCYVPTIPNGIVNCNRMFMNCTELTVAPELPPSVLYCESMFQNCKSLTQPAVMRDGVQDLRSMYSGCTSLERPPLLPSSAIYLDYMLYNCSSLREHPQVNNTFASTHKMLEGTCTQNATDKYGNTTLPDL